MGRGKKKSTRCKTSKREHKHVDKSRKKALKSPASTKLQVPLNKIIDQNGRSAKYIHSKLIKQNKRNTPRKPRLSASAKIKIDEFIFGKSSKQKSSKQQKKVSMDYDDDDSKEEIVKNKQQKHYDDDSKDEEIETKNALDPRYDVLTIKNLDKKVNEKIIQKIVNRKLCQNTEEENALQQISLKCVSILTVEHSKIAKIKLKKIKDENDNGLASKIVTLLDGKKLFGNVIKCEILTK